MHMAQAAQPRGRQQRKKAIVLPLNLMSGIIISYHGPCCCNLFYCPLHSDYFLYNCLYYFSYVGNMLRLYISCYLIIIVVVLA